MFDFCYVLLETLNPFDTSRVEIHLIQADLKSGTNRCLHSEPGRSLKSPLMLGKLLSIGDSGC